ncbi:MAG TPA: hypothetical protein VGK85_10945 [Myxococcaceae bacterium]|jgi:hypothetical protein
MALLNKGIAPDRLEMWLRFLAGATFGALLTGIPLAIGWPFSRGLFAAAIVSSALGFGLVARSLGDRFWQTARDWLWLFWP